MLKANHELELSLLDLGLMLVIIISGLSIVSLVFGCFLVPQVLILSVLILILLVKFLPEFHTCNWNPPKVSTSMSRKGNCWDNAVCESFFGALK